MSTIIGTLYRYDLIDSDVQHRGYAPEWDAYKARLADVGEQAPARLSTGHRSALVLLDEQVVALVNTAWLAGAEYGERLMKGEIAPSLDD